MTFLKCSPVILTVFNMDMHKTYLTWISSYKYFLFTANYEF